MTTKPTMIAQLAVWLSMVLFANTAVAQVTLNGSMSFEPTSGFNGSIFDASASDKLVIVATGEHNFPNNPVGDINSITYDGVALTQAVNRQPIGVNPSSDITANDIWYLDNPGSVHTGGVLSASVVGNGNNYVFTALGLSGTQLGVGATAISAPGSKSVDLAATGSNSFVLASLGMGGDGNTANVGAVSAVAPATLLSALEAGSNWAGHVTSWTNGVGPGISTYAFTGGSTGGVHTIAAEFLAATVGPPPPTPVSLLSTDFTGRVVMGATASNIPWVTNGIADPGDLTAVPVGGGIFGGLFDTLNAQGHFAPDRNTGNEGPWSVDIPIALTTPEVVINEVVIDWQHFNNSGNFQGVNRSVDWTASLIGSDSGLVAMDDLLNINGTSGVETFDFGGVTITDDESWILQILAQGSNATGNNTGLSAIDVIGFINPTVVPEPASIAIWLLVGLGLASLGHFRVRQKQ